MSNDFDFLLSEFSAEKPDPAPVEAAPVEAAKPAPAKPPEAAPEAATPVPAEAPTPAPVSAADALREALQAAGSLSESQAKAVVKQALGLSRLAEPRWQKALSEASAEVLEGQVKLLQGGPEESEVEGAPPQKLEVPESPPDNWEAPLVPPCGHRNWTKPPEEVQIEACCYEEHLRLKRGVRTSLPADWSVRGLTIPVPAKQRRSTERSQQSGFPGLCCSPKTGLYIGGIGNDCRYNPDTNERCEVHNG